MADTADPWVVVGVVLDHLARNGLRPVLDGGGDPVAAAADLLRALGIEPTADLEIPTAPVQQNLAELRAALRP